MKRGKALGTNRVVGVLLMSVDSLMHSPTALGAELRRKARHKDMSVAAFRIARKFGENRVPHAALRLGLRQQKRPHRSVSACERGTSQRDPSPQRPNSCWLESSIAEVSVGTRIR